MNEYLSHEALSFDDVLLVPKASSVRSRLDADTSTRIGPLSLKIPMIASPMESVTEWEMAYKMGKYGGLGILHRYMSPAEQIDQVYKIWDMLDKEDSGGRVPIVLSVGCKEAEQSRAKSLYAVLKNKIDMFNIDMANGHHILAKEMIDFVKNLTGGDVPVIAGNVATGEGFCYLADAGADAVRASVGSGSICSTRIKTGFGVPLLTTLFDCYEAKQKHPDYKKVAILADGGIRYPADLVKSLAAGADAVICGKMFATTNESPGEVVKINGVNYKIYRGMMSSAAMQKNGGMKEGTTTEGVTTQLPCTGPLFDVINDFMGGLRSGMSYGNARTIQELRECRFNRITNSGLTESHAFGTRV